jgi:hypothetical protein
MDSSALSQLHCSAEDYKNLTPFKKADREQTVTGLYMYYSAVQLLSFSRDRVGVITN